MDVISVDPGWGTQVGVVMNTTANGGVFQGGDTVIIINGVETTDVIDEVMVGVEADDTTAVVVGICMEVVLDCSRAERLADMLDDDSTTGFVVI